MPSRDEIFAGVVVKDDERRRPGQHDQRQHPAVRVPREDASSGCRVIRRPAAGQEKEKRADRVRGDDADAPARQRPARRDLHVPPPIDDVVQAHAKSVKPDRHQHDRHHALGIDELRVSFSFQPRLILRAQKRRADTVRNGREHQRHARELEDREQPL